MKTVSYSELIRRGSSKGEVTIKLNYIQSLFMSPTVRRAEIDITNLRKDKADKLMRALMTKYTARRETRKRWLRSNKIILVVECTA